MAGRKNAPSGMKASGKKLWVAVTEDYELEEHELIILKEACRTADRLDELDKDMQGEPLVVVNQKGDETANPRIIEQRQQSLVFARLMASLKLPDEAGAVSSGRSAPRGVYPKAV